ncbi:hypothetical protein AOQ84DRAFT_288646, partial [Glonium stellatum]
NSLLEVLAGYDDSKWVDANITDSLNIFRELATPTSLYSSDYGSHTGNILWRGHFTAEGNEGNFTIEVQGGAAFSVSLWLDN